MVSAAASPEIATVTGGSGPVDTVAFSRDGKTLVTGDRYGTIRLWDVATRRQIRSLPESAFPPAALSPDGKTLAARDAYGTAALWNAATGQQIRIFSNGNGYVVSSMAFSPDGAMLATGDAGDGVIRLWDVATGRQITSISAGPSTVSSAAFSSTVNSVAFSPDGNTLAAGLLAGADDNSATAALWNVATGRPIRSFPTGSATVDWVAFSPDGKVLATGAADGDVDLWDATTGQQVRSLTADIDSSVSSVAFSPDGNTLAAGDGDGAALWNPVTGGQIGTSFTGLGSVDSVAFSPDGKTLATGYDDGTARLWNIAADRPIRSFLTDSGTVLSVAFSPDGKTLATGDDNGTAQLWNAATGRQIRSLRVGVGNSAVCASVSIGNYVSSVAFSPDGKTLATSDDDGTLKLWNVATGKLISSFAQAPKGLTGTEPSCPALHSVAFSPDDQTLATGSDNGVADLWNVAIGWTGSLTGSADTVWSVAFSPDGKTLATGDDNGTVDVWNVATHQQISSLTAGSGAVYSLAFSPDGKTLAIGTVATDDSTVRLWDVPTAQWIGTPLTTGAVEAVAFSPDGKTLATGGTDGVELWNVSYLVDPLAQLCSQVGDSLTRAEWTQYVPPGPPYQDVCAQHS